MSESEQGAGRADPSLGDRMMAAGVIALVGDRLGPGGALALAPFLPAAEVLISQVRREFAAGAERRQAQMLGVAAKELGCDGEEFADKVSKTDHTVLVTAKALGGAAGTAWPPKVAALGRALADGLMAEDEAHINVADLVIPAMSEMDRLHLVLLELLVRFVPVGQIGPVETRPYDESRDQFTRSGFYAGDFTSSGWTAGWRRWTAYQIGEVRPALEPVLTSLIGTLERHGLAQPYNYDASMLAEFSKAQQEEASRSGPKAGQRITAGGLLPPTMSEMAALSVTPPSSWSPTELGERVLGYYEMAASDGDSRTL